MKPKRNYATLAVIGIAAVIIIAAACMGLSMQKKVAFDNTEIMQKNITVTSKLQERGTYIIVDSDHISYSSPERIAVTMKPNKSYTITYHSFNNQSGYWISSYAGIPDISVKKAVNTK